jgi:hypothetical protein
MQQQLRTVEHWARLPRERLVTEVTAAVRRPPADPSRFWNAVAADPVLAATVRGILSGLLRDKADTRDEAYWTYRVRTVRAALNATAPAPATRRTPTARQEPADRQDTGPALTASLTAPAAASDPVAASTPDPAPASTGAPATAGAAPAVAAVPAIEFQAPGY